MAKHKSWFLIGDGLVFCLRNGQEELIKETKRGIPSGAIEYSTKEEAYRELGGLRLSGLWPLFTPKAKPVEKEYS